MASLSQALRLGDLPPPHRTFQGHATHIREWSMMLRPNDSWSTCILQGIATFLHYASRRSAGSRYTTSHSPVTNLHHGRYFLEPLLRLLRTKLGVGHQYPFLRHSEHGGSMV